MTKDGMVRVTVPRVPDGADVHRSWRRVLTGLDERAEGSAAVLGPDVGHGAIVETAPGALVLAVDEHITGWAEPYYGSRPYPLMDAALTLHLVQEDGTLKALWARHFKTRKGAFGSAGIGQLRKHLGARPPVEGVPVREMEPGPGRPNFSAGTCRWCEAPIPKGGGVLVGRGPDTVVEHRGACPARPAEAGTYCALCKVAAAPGTAHLVLVRDGSGRREVQHIGRCKDHPSYEAYEQQRAEQRDAAEARRAAEKAADTRRAAQRAKAAEMRQAKAKVAREVAEEMQRRVESLAVVKETGRKELFDKGLNPYGERMRLVEVEVVLADGAPARWWDVSAYSGRLEGDDDRGGRFFLLDDARREYQRYKYEAEQYQPCRRPRVGTVPCPADGAKHCDNCGSTEAMGGWMSASLGQACDVDCYNAMSDAPGAHARVYHP